jgi:antitoxin CptB
MPKPPPAAPDETSVRRRRILYRSSHRGTKELDFLLGGFVASRLEALGPEETARMEALLDEGDNDLFDWITGKMAGPVVYNDLIRMIRSFNENRPRS